MRIDDQTTVADYLVLGTWEALTLLGEACELCDAGEVAELLSRAEEILTSVVSELPGHCPGRQAGQYAITAVRHSARRLVKWSKSRLLSSTDPRTADRNILATVALDRGAARSFLTLTARQPR